ncbi:Hypothetical predicted protein, partial [Olea europaea subsp. europaea]
APPPGDQFSSQVPPPLAPGSVSPASSVYSTRQQDKSYENVHSHHSTSSADEVLPYQLPNPPSSSEEVLPYQLAEPPPMYPSGPMQPPSLDEDL